MASKYLVLSRNGDGSWKEIGTVEATTPMMAVEQLGLEKPGTFVGIAEGNIMDVETVTTLKAIPRRSRWKHESRPS